MIDLAEFLLARIAEDEGVARDMQDQARLGRPLLQLLGGGTGIRALTDPARILAECEAKRRIVAEHPIYRGPRILEVDSSGTDYGCELCHCIDPIRVDGIVEANGYCETLLLLALPYADHPDYREKWRP